MASDKTVSNVQRILIFDYLGIGVWILNNYIFEIKTSRAYLLSLDSSRQITY